jgi:hypothetical protein
VVIKHSSAAEVARLLDALLGPEKLAQEAAAARLSVLGPRAVERLSTTVAGLRDARQIVAVLDVLERIGDARAVAVAEPFLTSSNEDVATAGVALARCSLHAKEAEWAARAADALVAVAVDGTRPESVRRAAVEALQDLPEDVLTPLRRHAAVGPDVAPAASGATPSPAPDHAWLAAWSDGAADAGSAEAVREAVVKIGSVVPLAVLHRTVGRLRVLEAAAGEEAGEWRAVRGMVHQTLAARGSRVALYDLQDTVERTPEQLTVTMLAALGALGNATVLEPVADAWARVTDPWLKSQLREVLQAIVGSKSMTRRHAAVRRAAARHPGLIDSLSMPSQTTPSRRRAGRT